MSDKKKGPLIGFTIGDLNGIGIELILKTFMDTTMFDICTPIVFGSAKVLNFYKKNITECNVNIFPCKEQNVQYKQINVFNCWEDVVEITPGIQNNIGGKYAALSLLAATKSLKEKKIDALVTAPINKQNIKSPEFNFVGHTPFFKYYFNAEDVLMLMVSDNMKVSLVTEHIAIKDVINQLTTDTILKKIKLLYSTLKQDFNITTPRIAVLGLNPHNGDNGLTGTEESKIIIPAIKQASDNHILVFGPYSADAFFARAYHLKFDAILAMYHDQGLIPFKSLSIGEGINYTAGLDVVRTSPDHGTAMDLAGKNIADIGSFRKAIFDSIDIYNNKIEYAETIKNPLKKIQHQIHHHPNLNIEDEDISAIKEENMH